MQVKYVKGKTTIVLVKANAACFLQSKILLNVIARNLPDDDADQQSIRNATATLQKVVSRFGAKYVNDDGELIETKRESLAAEGVPS